MQSVDGQAYLFFWLTVDGYRASAEQQLNALKMQQLSGKFYLSFFVCCMCDLL